MEFKTGTLVKFRGRPWVVQQSSDPELLMLKPLGGAEDETVGLYKPLWGENAPITSFDFRRPSAEDIVQKGYSSAARILYNACRLSFRDIAGPFACLGRLSFEPRPYQMVPLIMALQQERIRLLISDDVGIGKTLESLLIAKELLDRKEIERFAVICLPHLCEQWQNEIKDKFGLDAEIIRSSTVTRLERGLRGDQNVFRDIPFQVISIDYVKSLDRSRIFLDHCPDFIIVDEAHTCARPKGTNNSQQQRYALLRKLAQSGKQLVLLTATPHSGQTEEFQSLIGLLRPEFESFTLSTPKEREALSHHFIQRRRVDIAQYLGGETVFPTRMRLDNDTYKYSSAYLQLLDDVKDYIKNGLQEASGQEQRKQRYLYWDLLALMRGVMSSPDAGISMLRNKVDKHTEDASVQNTDDTDTRIYVFNDHLKDFLQGDDIVPEAFEKASGKNRACLSKFISDLQQIKENDDDAKVKAALEMVEIAIGDKKNPIVFCQYIQTAEYVGQYIKTHLSASKKTKDVAVEIITSRLADEERKMKIDALCQFERHVLVCTDCLSEGVNLQQGFEAVIHYDLPWNPNRVEQRNGRIDRFGQTAPEVLISTLRATNNAVDDIILNVLYRKQEAIRQQLGVYLPIADDDASIMETLIKKIIDSKHNLSQPSLFSDEDFETDPEEEKRQIQAIAEKQRISHTYFAHNTKGLDPSRLQTVLDEAKRVIGGVSDTKDFVLKELANIGVNVKDENENMSYSFLRAELPQNLQHYFGGSSPKVRISFASPTPKGYCYIGRNHVFVEDLSRGVVNDTIDGGTLAASRALVMTTDVVEKMTTVMLMRVRSVICQVKKKDQQLVGEEMIFIGYRGRIETHDFLSPDDAERLFLTAKASADTDLTSQQALFTRTMGWTHDNDTLRKYTDEIALERARALVEVYSRYRTYLATDQYHVVRPVLPMDVIAAYVFIPKN